MRLIHFAAEPLAGVYPVPWQPVGTKPKGLWVSDEDDYGWREWCTNEDFGTGRLEVAHEIQLAEDANVLHIADAHGIDELTREFRTPGYEMDGYRLNWPSIAALYQGVIITPYVYERRLAMHCGWYYPWDCASGCIWDTTAIAEFRVVELSPLPTDEVVTHG